MDMKTTTTRRAELTALRAMKVVLQDREVLGTLRTLRALGRLDKPSFHTALEGGGLPDLPEASRDVLRNADWVDLDRAFALVGNWRVCQKK
jgi:hypothetical protein